MKIKPFKLKTILLSTMLLLLCFCLSGCASVNFVTYHNSDGSICEYVFLNIDEQTLTEHGYNIDAVKHEIKTNSHTEANNLIKSYQNKLTIELQQNLLSNEEYSILFSGIKLVEKDWENEEYIIGLSFSNSTVYKKYHSILNNIEFNSNPKKVEKLFYTKTYYYGTANYGDYSIFNRIYNYYSNTIFSSISPQKTNLTYSYSVSNRRFHSDADNISLDTNGNYVHTWNISPDNPGKQIHFYTITANRGIWIICCIGAGLVICTTLSIIGLIKILKNKKIYKNN